VRGLRRFVEQPAPAAADVLKRFTRSRPAEQSEEVCEMCGEVIGREHPHVVNIESRSLLCTCRGCYLLFTPEGAGGGKYRAVPDRYLYDPAFKLSDSEWDDIQIPVNIAFFFINSTMSRFVSFYPSPAGATESLLDLGTWEGVIAANPQIPALTPDVEALLLIKETDRFECFLVPIDACYELAGVVKLHWKGFAGGEEAWSRIDAFLDRLRDRSRLVEHLDGNE
jgi:uncharacterized protein DUF5947